MTDDDSAEPARVISSVVVKKGSGRGKPGEKPQIPRGPPKDTENSSSKSRS